MDIHFKTLRASTTSQLGSDKSFLPLMGLTPASPFPLNFVTVMLHSLTQCLTIVYSNSWEWATFLELLYAHLYSRPIR